MPRRPDRHRPVTALVFAGGGSLGAVQVGMLKALVTEGVEADLASAAIPGVLPPVRIRGHCLIDGGVANHTPLSTAVDLGAKRVIVLPTGAPCTLERLPLGILEIVLHSLNLFTVQQLLKDAAYYRDKLEIIILPPLCPLSSSAYDFSVAGELIDRAANQTYAWLKQHGLSPAGIPPELAPHTHR
ncbi:patatin-like phospholipase family protein [Methylohalobius crimeensis]|uniref:patatin-like phospholipase family protein n=1 Tax=Methylohalobius crimeensis TaxID=244365 RepID=UPI0003B5B5FA|nr:patatin-like phospholipase family protein [Methylohalobius crimeensis]